MYDNKIYEDMWNSFGGEISYNSAMEILNILFKYYKPSSVIDIGCGIGSWLKAFSDLGIRNYKGLDGINIDKRLVPKENIQICNFIEHKNIDNIKYDLVTSLEVAEHISNEYSEDFINLLISYRDIILFSAAIPGQPGVDHNNCQPLLFWVNIFNKKGFDCFDFIRNQIYYNDKVDYYYSQNILLFVKREKTDIFTKQSLEVNNSPIFYYHSRLFNQVAMERDKLNSKINKISWWIPIRKLRDKFRSL